MIKSIFSFVLRLAVFLIIILPLDYFIIEEVLKVEFVNTYYFVLAYFTLLVLFTQVYMNNSLKKRPQVFVWTFLGVVGIKMFLSLMILVIIIYAGVNESKIFGVNFISLYFAFSTFSVLQILKAQRASVNSGENEDKIKSN